METHITALSGLIDDLFELSRLEAGDVQWTLEQVHVEELVEETVAAMLVQARAKGVDVHCEMPSSLAHGGRIWLAPAEQGTMMRFVLPGAVPAA
jgi:K+-sensing histidine kinase KdpD